MSSLPPASESEHLRALAEAVRESGILGRERGHLLTLFDFLVDQSVKGNAPKELEIAVEVFGKRGSFDAAQDARVRVYAHKLRRKLEEFANRSPGTSRLALQKGSYRLVIEHGEVSETATTSAPATRAWKQKLVVVVLAVSLLSNVLLLTIAGSPKESNDEFSSSDLWHGLLRDDKPIAIVFGDYYMLAETDDGMSVRRLVREFDINSKHDLAEVSVLEPKRTLRYMDVDLTYLPSSAVMALHALQPLLSAADTGGQRTRVLTMSQLTPETLKSSHVIYIGFISGLGTLESVVFAGSRLKVGSSYDELVDRQTDRRYVSQDESTPASTYTEYGYFSTFVGPEGNRFVVLAGTRDVAVMHMAQIVASLTAGRTASAAFEALYEVRGLNRVNLRGDLALMSDRKNEEVWSAPRAAPDSAAATQ